MSDVKRVLFVYYSFTKQTEMVVGAMAQQLAARGCTVTKAPLAFPDAHYGGRFSKLPMSSPILHIVGMLVAQRRRKTGDITIPPEAQHGDYDLVVFGSPTWWLTTCMPVRSYLHSPAAKAVLDGKPFAAVSVSRRYYKGNLADIKKLGEQAGGRSSGSTHFVSDGKPGDVDDVLARLHAQEPAEAPLPRRPVAAAQPQSGLCRRREALRGRAVGQGVRRFPGRSGERVTE